jgi:hypothetical protein
MTQRKGEIGRADLNRKWPHHVARSADKVRGVMNSQIVWSVAKTLSTAPVRAMTRRKGENHPLRPVSWRMALRSCLLARMRGPLL